MRWIAFAVVVAALTLANSASAQSTFQLGLAGSGTHIFDAYECPNQVCDPPAAIVAWWGTVVVKVGAQADGLYTGGDLIQVSLASNLTALSTDGFGTGGFGPPNSFTATIIGGALSSLEGSFGADPYTTVTFDGLTVKLSIAGAHHVGTTNANAVLTVAAIPEPSELSLLLGGLAAMAATIRRRSVGL